MCVCVCVCERERERDSPAVDQDGVVASSPLNLSHLFNDINDCLDVGRAAIWSPVCDVELVHLMGLVSLYNTAQLETQPDRERERERERKRERGGAIPCCCILQNS